MSTDRMRAEFETKWGATNEAQGLRFIPELNTYGCEMIASLPTAESKSQAWYYWQASRAALVIELPPRQEVSPIGGDGVDVRDSAAGDWMDADAVFAAVEAAGVKALSF